MRHYTLQEARKLSDADLMAAFEEAEPAAASIGAAIRAKIAASLADIGKTVDTASDKEYYAAEESAADLEAEYRAVYYHLFVAREEMRARQSAAAISARTPRVAEKCRKCGYQLTAGRCDECDDWDN